AGVPGPEFAPMNVLFEPVVLPFPKADPVDPAEVPTAVLLFPVEFTRSAPCPIAVLEPPEVFDSSAAKPNAAFVSPVVLLLSALLPIAVLNPPTVFENKAPAPTAELWVPMVFKCRVAAPMAEF